MENNDTIITKLTTNEKKKNDSENIPVAYIEKIISFPLL
jgi:hypothetical protein